MQIESPSELGVLKRPWCEGCVANRHLPNRLLPKAGTKLWVISNVRQTADCKSGNVLNDCPSSCLATCNGMAGGVPASSHRPEAGIKSSPNVTTPG
jgi:hypothetical protein